MKQIGSTVGALLLFGCTCYLAIATVGLVRRTLELRARIPLSTQELGPPDVKLDPLGPIFATARGESGSGAVLVVITSAGCDSCAETLDVWDAARRDRPDVAIVRQQVAADNGDERQVGEGKIASVWMNSAEFVSRTGIAFVPAALLVAVDGSVRCIVSGLPSHMDISACMENKGPGTLFVTNRGTLHAISR